MFACFSAFQSLKVVFFEPLRSHCLTAGEKDFAFNIFVYIVNVTDHQLINANWEPRVGVRPKT